MQFIYLIKIIYSYIREYLITVISLQKAKAFNLIFIHKTFITSMNNKI